MKPSPAAICRAYAVSIQTTSSIDSNLTIKCTGTPAYREATTDYFYLKDKLEDEKTLCEDFSTLLNLSKKIGEMLSNIWNLNDLTFFKFIPLKSSERACETNRLEIDIFKTIQSGAKLCLLNREECTLFETDLLHQIKNLTRRE